MKQTTKGTIAMIATGLLWSMGGIFIKLVPWNPLAIAGLRGLIGGLVMYVYLRIRGIKPVFNKDTVKIAIALCERLHISLSRQTKLPRRQNAIVIHYCAPVYVLPLHRFCAERKKLRPLDIAVVPMTESRRIPNALSGRLAKGALWETSLRSSPGICFAALFIHKRGRSRPNAFQRILQGQFLTAIIGFPVLFADKTRVHDAGDHRHSCARHLPDRHRVVLYSIAYQNAPLLTCSLLAVLELAVKPVWVFLFAGENPGICSLVGGVIVIVVHHL
jgi:hypothetical protein